MMSFSEKENVCRKKERHGLIPRTWVQELYMQLVMWVILSGCSARAESQNKKVKRDYTLVADLEKKYRKKTS